MQKSRYTIRILDDDSEFLDAIGFLLRTEGWNCVTQTDALSFFRNLTDEPGCIILDVRMPTLSGPDVQAQLNGLDCKLPVIFLTGHGDLDLAVEVFRAGACDFLQKPVNRDKLVAAIERVVALDDERRRAAFASSPLGRWNDLTDREKDIVRDVTLFLSNKAIAEKRGISERTVEAHRSSALRKLGIHKPGQAAELIEQLRREQLFI